MKGSGIDWRRLAPSTWHFALFIVFLAALALRLYGLDWDDGADLHPDELYVAKIVLIDRIHLDWPPDIANLLDPARSGLNPRSTDPLTGKYREFPYGALPLWVTDFAAWALSKISEDNWNGIDHAYLVGRSISALLSALTILPIAVLGTLAGGRMTGLIAALFAAFAPMSIQLAHFFTTDSWLTFFVALSLLACVRAAQEGRTWQFAAAGAAFGFAMATKGSVFTLAAPIGMAVAIDAIRRVSHYEGDAMRASARNAFAAAIASGLGFLAFEPYALLRPQVYLQSLRTQADIVGGAFDVPFTRVYSGTTPFIYQVEQLVRWGYGPVAGLLALAGIGVIIFEAFKRRAVPSLILASWVLPYSAVLFVADAKFLRYLEPLTPALAVGAGLVLTRLACANWFAPRFRVAKLVIPAVIVLAAAWAAAFVSVYAHENPRLAATKWIYGTIAPGSELTAEYWDDPLPRALAYDLTPQAFGLAMARLDSYRDLPPPEASNQIYDVISSADVIVQSSRRVEAAMRAEPWRYPVQGRFFDELERGSLGFLAAARFDRLPTFGGVTVDDRAADESFLNYDHPEVAIYGRTADLSRQSYDNLMAWALQRPWFPAREPPQPTLLLDTPVGENPSQNDARWSAAITGTTAAAVIVWVLFMVALVVVGAPIARLAFPAFPDIGWGLARTVGLAVAAYPVWLGASLQLVRYRAIWVLLSLAIVAAVGWRLTGRSGWPTITPIGKTEARLWLHAEAAFWLTFVFFLVLRFLNPDSWHPLWGGEKPMEFALINAIGRSAYFPPYDPWFADGYVNYYYYGFYLVSFMLKATGIPSEIGFNLAQPAVMALLASGVFSCGAALGQRLTRSPRMTQAAGWGAAIAIVVAGNLTALRTAFAPHMSLFDPFVRWTWSGSRAIDNTITEFPFFTGLYADLHAHVVALPLTVVIIALCLSLTTIRRVDLGQRTAFLNSSSRQAALLIALLALFLGTLSTTNVWDVPVYALLAIVTLSMATAAIKPLSRRIGMFFLAVTGMVGGAWLLFLPFHRHFVALFSQIAFVRDPSDLLQFLSHFGALIAICAVGLTVFLTPSATKLSQPAVWPLLALAGGALGLAVTARQGGFMAELGSLLLICSIAVPPLAAAWMLGPRSGSWTKTMVPGVVVVTAIVAVAIIAVGRSVFALLLALGVTAGIGWWRLPFRAERFVCLLTAAGFFTAAGVEIIVIADDLIETSAYRMNTVFKFYNQVWILLGLSAVVIVARMAHVVLKSRSAPSWIGGRLSGQLAWSRFGLAMTAVLLLATLSYPALATGPRLAQRFSPSPPPGTLNALAWMDMGTVPILEGAAGEQLRFDGDRAAIAWLWQNVEGTPVIAEASIGPYRCNGSRISIATGLPTIIGWERHEQQQRYPDSLPDRVSDVRTLYTSSDVAEKEAIVARYNVEYVIVGDLERYFPIANNECTATGSAEGIAAFEDMVGRTLEVAHSELGTTIYRVKRPGSDT
jgi:YYY domain-containing protein